MKEKHTKAILDLMIKNNKEILEKRINDSQKLYDLYKDRKNPKELIIKAYEFMKNSMVVDSNTDSIEEDCKLFEGVSEKTFSHIYLSLILPEYYNNLDKFMDDFFYGKDTNDISLFQYKDGAYTGELIGLPSIKEGQFNIKNDYRNKEDNDYHTGKDLEWIEFEVYSGDEAYYLHFIGFELNDSFKFVIPDRRNVKSIKNEIVDFVSTEPGELLATYINIVALNKKEFESNPEKLTELIFSLIEGFKECEEDDTHPLDDAFLEFHGTWDTWLVDEEIISIIEEHRK
jgi:hypothetical protein